MQFKFPHRSCIFAFASWILFSTIPSIVFLVCRWAGIILLYCVPGSTLLLFDCQIQIFLDWKNIFLGALFHIFHILFPTLYSLLVMLHCLSRASSWSWSTLPLSVDPEDFIVSVGVIIFSYTSQIFLPPLEGSMKDRGQFNCMLGWTHGAACIMKTLFSLLVSDIGLHSMFTKPLMGLNYRVLRG